MEYALSINDPQPLPGAVPSSGFLPPDDAFPVERASGPEVLVNLPGEGLTGWARKVAGVLRRGWQQQLAIFAITHALPGFVLYALAVGACSRSGTATSRGPRPWTTCWPRSSPSAS
ncbi:hypothetical protein ACFQZ4_47595 [Catellatospora coxensis]